MNTVMLVFNVITALMISAAYLSPDFLDRAAVLIRARASALRASRKVYRATFDSMIGPDWVSGGGGPKRPWRTPSVKRLMDISVSVASCVLIVAALFALVVMPQ